MINQKKGGVVLSYIQMISNVLIKFLYTPFLLRSLGQNEYGLYSLVMSIVGYLAILDLGFGSTVTRYTIKFRTENDDNSLRRLYATLSVIYIIIGVLALSISLVLSACSDMLYGSTMTPSELSKLRIMIVLCGVNLLFTFPLQIASSVIIAYERFVFKNGVFLAKTILQPVVMVLLLVLLNMKSVGAIVVVTVFNIGTSLIYYLYAFNKLDFKFSFRQFDPLMIRPLLSFSVWMFCMTLFEHLQFNSGQFILGLFQGTDVIAVWGIAMIFVLNYRSLSSAITNVFMPSYLKSSFKLESTSINETTVKMTRIQSMVLLLILFNYLLFGQQFIQLWAGKEYNEAFRCSIIIMIPMTISLLLDFCYLYQIAHKLLAYRTITLFSGLIIAFIIVYYTRGINLNSFAFIIALSILLGQILSVLYFIITKMRVINLWLVLKNCLMVVTPLFIVYLLIAFFRPYFVLRSPVIDMLFWIIIFNSLVFVLLWRFTFTESEKNTIKKVV